MASAAPPLSLWIKGQHVSQVTSEMESQQQGSQRCKGQQCRNLRRGVKIFVIFFRFLLMQWNRYENENKASFFRDFRLHFWWQCLPHVMQSYHRQMPLFPTSPCPALTPLIALCSSPFHCCCGGRLKLNSRRFMFVNIKIPKFRPCKASTNG